MRRRCLLFQGMYRRFLQRVYLLFLRRRHTPLTCRKRLGINFSQEENAYEETHRFSAAGIGDGTEPGTRHCLGSREPRRQVRVVVENTTYAKADGAAWDGTLVDKWVDLAPGSSMMDCIVSALGSYSQTRGRQRLHHRDQRPVRR